ncbi:hypothetical protein AB3Z09_04000 [Companilactobacillus farciminis]|uniref:hypothetical protein n=1 Tax=Companilactobacillus farciminis TaxID=1612 RepID=UPI0034D46E92
MKFLKLIIQYDNNIKQFNFSNKTLIFSSDNSVGKSTLLRLLLYGVGYPIPGTVGIKFHKANIQVVFERDNNKYTTKREDKYIEIYKENKFIASEVLDGNDDAWLSYIWGIDSVRVLRNILGAIYMDQDKGWTLLNRGKVIGNIRFNIRDLLIGLSKKEKNLDSILNELDEQKRTLKQTRQLRALGDSASSYKDISIESMREKNDTKLIDKYKNLKLKRTFSKRELNKVKKNIHNEKGLRDYLLSLNIMVSNGKQNIVVNEENLLNFNDNIDFLKQKSAILQEDIEEIDSQISGIKRELEQGVSNLFSEKDIVARTFNDIASIDINDSILEARESELIDSISKLNSKVESDFIDNNELIEETRSWINVFAKKLGILDVVKDKKYIFTRDLKSISGTIYYKVVFSFKMAYIKTIEKHAGILLPIILDSPSGREVTNRNISEVIEILNDYFEDNQIIIASINKYDLKNVKEIKIKKRLLD